MKLKSLLCSAALALMSVTSVARAQFIPCNADITLDHVVNVADLLAVISSWGPCMAAPPSGSSMGENEIDLGGGEPTMAFCAADIAPPGDPDGFVNVPDLLAVISGWGTCGNPGVSHGSGYVVWCEDWSTGNYSRWTSAYNNDTNPCTVAGFTAEHFVSPASAMKSQVTCVGGVNGVHRGYGGLRFNGESVLPTFAINSPGGIDAPNGIVIQWRGFLQVPYLFNAQDLDLWMSMMTATDDCSNAWHRVITLNIDNTSMRLRPQHVDGVQYAFGAPAFPRDQWVRVTVYLNLYTGEMHVWQNGQKIAHAWFTRPNHTTCQYHFGLYCSGANSNITYYEDDMRIIKLTDPLPDLVTEPAFSDLTSPCAQPPG